MDMKDKVNLHSYQSRFAASYAEIWQEELGITGQKQFKSQLKANA